MILNQYNSIGSFGENNYSGKISIGEAEMNRKQSTRNKKKNKIRKKILLNMKVEKLLLILLKVEYFQ